MNLDLSGFSALRKTPDIKVNLYSPTYSGGEGEGEAAPCKVLARVRRRHGAVLPTSPLLSLRVHVDFISGGIPWAESKLINNFFYV